MMMIIIRIMMIVMIITMLKNVQAVDLYSEKSTCQVITAKKKVHIHISSLTRGIATGRVVVKARRDNGNNKQGNGTECDDEGRVHTSRRSSLEAHLDFTFSMSKVMVIPGIGLQGQRTHSTGTHVVWHCRRGSKLRSCGLGIVVAIVE